MKPFAPEFELVQAYATDIADTTPSEGDQIFRCAWRERNVVELFADQWYNQFTSGCREIRVKLVQKTLVFSFVALVGIERRHGSLLDLETNLL